MPDHKSIHENSKMKPPPENDFNLHKSDKDAADVDSILVYLGRYGKFQLIQSLLLILGGLSMTPAVIGGIFTGKDIGFKCARDPNATKGANTSTSVVALSTCHVEILANGSSKVLSRDTCSKYDYEDGSGETSYISEWDLVCASETVGQLAQILTMVGMGVGAFLLPPLGDRFGRKKLLLGSELTVLLAIGAMAFTPSFEVFVLLKFLSGAGNQGQTVSAGTMHMELYPVEQRSVVGLVLTVIWVISYCCLVAVAWLLQQYNWRTLQLVYVCFCLGVFLQAWFLDESLRWLLGKGHIRRAKTLLKKACKMNRKNYTELVTSLTPGSPTDMKPFNDQKRISDASGEECPLPPESDSTELSTKGKRGNSSLFDLFRTPGIRRISLVMAYTWCVNSLVYYGLTLMTSTLFGDPYLNNLIAAILELTSGVMMYFAVFRFGRKHTLIVFMLAAGVCLFSTVLVVNLAPSSKGYSILITCLTQLGKCFISGSFNLIWCYTPELYPTNIRNMGVGICSTAARVGSSFSPLFKLLALRIPWLPGTIFSVSCFISVFLLMTLPETRWRELPESVAEVERWFLNDTKMNKENNSMMSEVDHPL